MINTVYANPKNEKVRAALYCRLSKDDANEGPSASIQNQRELLRRVCDEQGWTVTEIFEDDGYSGLSMNRPAFQRMLSEIEQGRFDVVLTKDLSRLGRNHLDTDGLIEKTFPRYHVRYIAVNDAVDTSCDSDIFLPLRNLMNEMYSSDVSKKVHSSYLTKAQSGKYTGVVPPFGYRKDPQDKNHLLIDDDTAWIIREIFEMAVNGKGPSHIRRRLEDMKIPCPAWWSREKGYRNHVTKFEKEDPENGRFMWDFTTIQTILTNPVYVGAICSQKTVYRFKTGWITDKKPEDWIIVEGMHEPLVDRETFDLVQEKIKNRKRPDAWGNYSLFVGLVKCGQCGSAMNLRRGNQKDRPRSYTCSKYNRYGVAHCSQHKILYDTLYNIVLTEIRACARRALSDAQEAADELRENWDERSEREAVEKSVAEDTERIRALERVIERLYSDVTAGRISEENFTRILERSQSEQEALKKRVTLNRERLERQAKEQADNARFVEIIKDYADIQELDAVTLNRLIQKIVVHEDRDGETVRQTVEIFFNFNTYEDKTSLIPE